MRPFHSSNEYQRALKDIQRRLGEGITDFDVCIYAAPFGIIPIELDEVYPLSQYEIAAPLELETIKYTARQVVEYIMTMNYERVFLFQDTETWKGRIVAACRQICEKEGLPLEVLDGRTVWPTFACS